MKPEGGERCRRRGKDLSADGLRPEDGGGVDHRGGTRSKTPRRSRLRPYRSAQTTWGSDAHFGASAMRTGRDGASHDAAAFYASISQLGKRRTGETGRDGSDPPVRGPGTGADAVRVFTRSVPAPWGVAPDPSIPTREGGLSAASRRRVTRSPTGRPSGNRASPSKAGVPPMARATAQAAKSGTRPSQVTDGLPARDCWTGATSRRRVDGRAHPTLPDAVPGIERGGSLPPRPHPPERHRRSGGRCTTAKQPATSGTSGAHMEAAFSCTCTPMSMCARGTPPHAPKTRRHRSRSVSTAWLRDRHRATCYIEV